MLMSEVRALSDQQLREELTKTYQELQNLRFRAATNQLPNTNTLRTARKSIARLQTALRERELTGR